MTADQSAEWVPPEPGTPAWVEFIASRWCAGCRDVHLVREQWDALLELARAAAYGAVMDANGGEFPPALAVQGATKPATNSGLPTGTTPVSDTAAIREWTRTGFWPRGTDVDETLLNLCDALDAARALLAQARVRIRHEDERCGLAYRADEHDCPGCALEAAIDAAIGGGQ